MIQRPLACVDIETTGTNPLRDRVTEVAAVVIEEGTVVEEWSTLVNPGTSVPPYIQSITGITNEMLEDAPDFAAIVDTLDRLLAGRVFVAHNARFDYGFLKNEFRRTGRSLRRPVLCTVKLSRRLFPEYRRHNLDSLIARHGLGGEARHRALGDARVLWRFLDKLEELRDPPGVAAAVAELLARPALPAGLAWRDMEAIPDGPGVYLFYDERNTLLYVGKSVNLRSRVMSHFSGDHSLAKDMQLSRQVRRVDWVETAGELGALLKEAQLIKERQPVYNRALRRHAGLCSWWWDPDDAADAAPRLVDTRSLPADTTHNLYGLFRSRRVAQATFRKLVDEHGLCHKVTGLEKTGRGPCFAHQLRRCRGACVGLETSLQHRLRMMTALAPLRVRTWPFAGRIGLRERAPEGGRVDVHLLDHWRYLGTVTDARQRELFDARGCDAPFDADIYGILWRFMERRHRRLDVLTTEELEARGY